MTATVVLENDRVRVLRVRHEGHERRQQASRGDRLVIYLNSGYVRRIEDGQEQKIRREAGDVVWRDGSLHQIENLSDADHEVLIVELK